MRTSIKSALAIVSAVTIMSLTFAIPSGADSGGSTAVSGPPTIPCCGGGGDLYWGFDQLSRFTATSLSADETSFGFPGWVGRYLTYGSPGFALTTTEANMLGTDGIPIRLFASPGGSYGTTTEATTDADGAIAAADGSGGLGIAANTGVAIYLDVEPGMAISTAFINKWYSLISAAGFTPGFYERSTETTTGHFENTFCLASATTIAGSLLYSQQPQVPSTGATSASDYKYANAPATYSPEYQGCESQPNSWQYLIAGTYSPVDVDEGATPGLWYS